MKLKLRDGGSRVVEIGIGNYRRVVVRADGPIEVELEEGETLLRTGLFEEAAEAERSSEVTTQQVPAEEPAAPEEATQGVASAGRGCDER